MRASRSSWIEPWSGVSSPSIRRRRVVFPAPFRPTMPILSPRATLSSTPRRISVAPWLFPSPEIDRTVMRRAGEDGMIAAEPGDSLGTRTMKLTLLALLTLCFSCQAFERPRSRASAAPAASARETQAEAEAIKVVLDDWHAAAAAADGPRYFGHMAADAVFLGTDASERWPLAEFRSFCEPYFARGVGWTYEPRERHVSVRDDLAWFDERLWNEKYGMCRGTGVLRHESDGWRIVHYSLTLLVPNELAPDVVAIIRGR